MGKKYSIGAKLVSNTLFISFEWIIVTLFSLLYWVIIGKTLLPSDYGVVSVFVNITVILGSLLPFGTSVALFKLIPEYIGRRELGKITSSIRFTIKLILPVSLIITLIILSFSNIISTTFKIPLYAVWLLPPSLLLFTMFTHQTDIMLGFQHAKKLAITSAIGQLFKVIFTAVLLLYNMKALGPIIGFIISSFLIFIFRIKYLLYNKPSVKINGKSLLFKFGVPALLARLTTLLLLSGSPLILAIFHAPELVGIFGIGMLLTTQLSVIPNIFSSALFPITSLLSISNHPEKKQAYFINSVLRYALLITLPLLIFVILFSDELIMLVSQASYLSAVSIIPILAIGALLLGISYIFTNSLYAIGRPDIQRNLIIFTSIVYITLAFPLSYLFSALGISIAYTTSTFILAAVSFVYLKKVLLFNIPWGNISKLIFANIFTFIVLLIFSQFAPNILVGIAYTILAGVVYLIILLFLKFYTKDDIKLLNKVGKYIPAGDTIIKSLSNVLSKFVEN